MNKLNNYLLPNGSIDWQKLSREIIAKETAEAVQTRNFKSEKEAKQFIERIARNRGNISIPLNN